MAGAIDTVCQVPRRRAIVDLGADQHIMKFLLFIAKLSVSAGLLYLALRTADLSAVADRLIGIDAVWFVVAVGVFAVQVVIASFRWLWVLRGIGEDAAPIRLIRFNAIATFFNQTLPSTVGGDAVRLWLIQRNGASWRSASHSVLLDRVFGLVVLVGLIAVLLPWSLEAIASAPGRRTLIWVVVTAAAGITVFFALGGRFDGWLAGQRLFLLLNGIARDARGIAAAGSAGPWVVGLSATIHAMTLVGVLALARSLELDLEFFTVVLVVPPVLLVIMVPVSIAGWGLREGAMVVAFGHAGLAQDHALALSVLFGAVLLVVGVIGAIVWLFGATERLSPPAARSLDIDSKRI